MTDIALPIWGEILTDNAYGNWAVVILTGTPFCMDHTEFVINQSTLGQLYICVSQGVCTEAGMYALRERRVHVTQEDFEMSVAKVSKVLEPEQTCYTVFTCINQDHNTNLS